MTWYKTGTVSVTNGSQLVVGAGTDFVTNVKPGFVFYAPDKQLYEVETVLSATQLSLASTYTGATAAGQAYAIFQTQGIIAELAARVAALVNEYQAIDEKADLSGADFSGNVSSPGFNGPIGQATPAAGTFTSATVAGNLRISGGDPNVGSDLTLAWDGTEGATVQSYGGKPLRLNPLGNNVTVGGNLGLGVVPSAWGGDKALQLPWGAVSSGYEYSINIASVAYRDNATWRYQITGQPATRYDGIGGSHRWFTAPAGTAGAAIGFTQEMALDESGNLILGSTSNRGGKLQVHAGGAYGAIVARLGAAPSDPNFSVVLRNGTSNLANTNQFTFGLEYGGNVENAGIRFYRGGGSSGGWLGFTSGDGTEWMMLDASGHLLAGASSGSCHRMTKAGAAGTQILLIGSSSHGASFYAADAFGASGAACAQDIGKNNTSGRSINAGGTINASGADYAEYMFKEEACGAVSKGDIVGVDTEGKVTDKWSSAVSFLVKSTDPSYVGGDVWGTEDALGVARPEEPQFTPPQYEGLQHPGEAPIEPAAVAEDADEAAQAGHARAMEAYLAAAVEYERALSAHLQDMAAHQARVEIAKQLFDTATYPTYLAALATFNQALEYARQKVDRIAYAGQVPVNVWGATPGDYIVPVQDGDGIKGVAVAEDDLSFAQYRKAVGIVQNILPDGRANIRVKVA